MTAPRPGPGLGTRLRHLLELLDGDVAKIYADLDLAGFRPRYTPVVRTLLALGPLAIRDLAGELGVTHSAASQTVNQMSRDGLVTLAAGQDARQRIVRLTEKANSLVPALNAEWDATEAARVRFEAGLPYPLTDLVIAAIRELENRPFHERVTEQLRGSEQP